MEVLEIVNDVTNNAYDYCFHTLEYENSNILCEIFGNCALYAWDSRSIKFIEMKRKRTSEEEVDISLILKDFHRNNFQVVEIWLRVVQVRNVNNLLLDGNGGSS